MEQHQLYADDNQVVDADGPVRFAVVGNSRASIPWSDRDGSTSVHAGARQHVAADLEARVVGGEIDFVVWLGDEVRWSVGSEWGHFGETFVESLDSAHLPHGEHDRVPSLVVAGDRDFVLDEKLVNLGDVFPGIGAEIGFNRISSWYTFDLNIGDDTWRMMALDSNKKAMGSRWKEQANWIPRAAKGEYDHLVLFMHHPRLTLALGNEMNADGLPQTLIDTVEEHTGILKLRAVFSAGSHTSEVFLPEGAIGTAYVVSGGGGDVSQDLERWGDGQTAGYEAIQLEPLFDLALQAELNALGETKEVSEKTYHRARAEADWEGFTGAYDSGVFPLTGYWIVELDQGRIAMDWRYISELGEASEPYHLDYVKGRGWRPGSHPAKGSAPPTEADDTETNPQEPGSPTED